MTIPITIVTGDTLKRIKRHADNAWINGKSHVRKEGRAEAGPEDQLVGQLGEYALAKYLGDEESYFARREQIDLTPTVGDGGSDFLGAQIDVKTSMMRKSQDPMRYNLLVRPRERHSENTYVLALVAKRENAWKVWLVGHVGDDCLPERPEQQGVFEGAYRVPAADLLPMQDLRRH